MRLAGRLDRIEKKRSILSVEIERKAFETKRRNRTAKTSFHYEGRSHEDAHLDRIETSVLRDHGERIARLEERTGSA